MPAAWLGFSEFGPGRYFERPSRVLVADDVADVVPCLLEAEAAVSRGQWAVGCVSYEAAPAFDPALRVSRGGSRFPLVWFALFDDGGAAAAWGDVVHGSTRGAAATTATASAPPEDPTDSERRITWHPNCARAEYDAAIAECRHLIEEGRTYQVNYAIRLRAELSAAPQSDNGPALSAFLPHFGAVLRAQECAFGAFLDMGGGHRVFSASPELFFKWDARSGRLTTRPMKGTARRGANRAEDASRRAELAASAKDRAENLMIVDLLRSDVARVCVPGSVRCASFCDVEAFPTVFQLTSTVVGETRPGVGVVALFRALFPCGSVTGAPKVATMAAIARLEGGPRDAYCGAVGFLAPDGRAEFSVGIRTVVEHCGGGTVGEACGCVPAALGAAALVYGVGGGITWDSRPASEYDEVAAKAAVLLAAGGRVLTGSGTLQQQQQQHLLPLPLAAASLLETLRQCGGCGRFCLLAGHLLRLQRSAASLERKLDLCSVVARLEAAAHAQAAGEGAEGGRGRCGCTGAPALRVRLLVDPGGGVSVESASLGPLVPGAPAPSAALAGDVPTAAGRLEPPEPLSPPQLVALSVTPVDSSCAELRHKTTARALYEEARAATAASVTAAPSEGAVLQPVFDALLHNERGEVTEMTIGNAVFQMSEDWWARRLSGDADGATAACSSCLSARDLSLARLVTPPASCGLLPGVLRRFALEGAAGASSVEEELLPQQLLGRVAALDCGPVHAGFDARPPPLPLRGEPGGSGGTGSSPTRRAVLCEAVVRLADLRGCGGGGGGGSSVQRAWLINSVRGWVEVAVVDAASESAANLRPHSAAGSSALALSSRSGRAATQSPLQWPIGAELTAKHSSQG